jgi:hypothetical protein
MIPISTFNLLIAVDILFIIYAVLDHRNRLYANIIASFLAGLLSMYLATAITSDIVYEVIGGVATVVDSPSAGNFLNLVGVVMFVYTLIMAYEVIAEALEEKASRDEQEREGDGL